MTEQEARERIIELAEEQCEQTDSIEEAVSSILDALDSDKALYRAYVRPAIRCAVQETIYRRRHRNRAHLKQRRRVTPDEMQEFQRMRILDTWPIGDKSLGDATKVDVIQEAATYRTMAEGAVFNESFMLALADRLVTDESKVRESWTDDECEQLIEKLRGQDRSATHSASSARAKGQHSTATHEEGASRNGHTPTAHRAPRAKRERVKS